MRGADMVEEGYYWILDHREEFLTLQSFICSLERERTRRPDGTTYPTFASVTRGSVYMLAQMRGIDISESNMFKHNNNLWSTVSRYITHYCPQTERIVHHRKCEVGDYIDRFGIIELPEDYIYRAAA